MQDVSPAKSIPPSQNPGPTQDEPLSCSTLLSKDVLDNLRRMHLSGRALEVCLYAHNLTFGNAGWRRQQGKSELSCTFDLASWAGSLEMNRSNLQRIIARLSQHKIISFVPFPHLPGRATFTWNVTFDEWHPGYDSHRSPEQAKNLGSYAQKKPSKLSTLEPSELNLLADESVPSELSMFGYSVPSELSQPAIEGVLSVPPELSTLTVEGSAGAAPQAPAIKVTYKNKRKTKENNVVASDDAAIAVVLVSSVLQEDEGTYPEEAVYQDTLLHSGITDPRMRAVRPSHSQPSHTRLQEPAHPLLDAQNEQGADDIETDPAPLALSSVSRAPASEEEAILRSNIAYYREQIAEWRPYLTSKDEGERIQAINYIDRVQQAIYNAERELQSLRASPTYAMNPMNPPKTNFVAAALAFDIPLDNKMRTAAQQGILTAVADWLNKHKVKPLVALESLRRMFKEKGAWLQTATVGGYLSLLPRYVQAGGVA